MMMELLRPLRSDDDHRFNTFAVIPWKIDRGSRGSLAYGEGALQSLPEKVGKQYAEFVKAAVADDETQFAETNSVEIAELLFPDVKPISPFLGLVKSEPERYAVFDKAFESKDILQFLLVHKFPLVTTPTELNSMKVYASCVKFQVYVFGEPDELKVLADPLQDIARKFKSKIMIILVDIGEENLAKPFLTLLGQEESEDTVIRLLEKQTDEISAECFAQIVRSECSLNFARDANEVLKYLLSNEVVHTLAKKSALKGLQEILILEVGIAGGSEEPLAIGDIQFPKRERYYRLQSPSKSSLRNSVLQDAHEVVKYFCSNEFVAAIAGRFLQCPTRRISVSTRVQRFHVPTKSSAEGSSSGQSTGGEQMKKQEDEWTILTRKWKPKKRRENADDPFVLIGKEPKGGKYFRVYDPTARVIWDRQQLDQAEAGYSLMAYDIEKGWMLMEKSRGDCVFYNFMGQSTVSLPDIAHDIPKEAKVIAAFVGDPEGGEPDSLVTVLAYLSGEPNERKSITVALRRGNDWVVGQVEKITDVSEFDRCAKLFGNTLYLLDRMSPRVVTVEMEMEIDNSLRLGISTSPLLFDGRISPRPTITLASEDQNLYLVSISPSVDSTETSFRFFLLRGDGAQIGREINLSHKVLFLTHEFGGEVYSTQHEDIVVSWGGPLRSAASRGNTWPFRSEFAAILRTNRRLSCTCEHQDRGLCLCQFCWIRVPRGI